MKRLPDWSPRLHRYLAAQVGKPFVRGRHDCGTFADGAVEAVTGKRVMADLMGDYDSLAGAMRALREGGFETPADAVSSIFAECPVSMARRGDLALIPCDHEWGALAVVSGPTVHALTAGGVGVVPLTRATRAWRVG